MIFFPLWPIIDTPQGPKCGCGDASCTDIGKHPRYKGWRALSESAAVEFTCYGIRTGREGGLVVFDLDDAPSRDFFAALCLKNGSLDLLDTLTVKTPRGWHLYFAAPALPIANYQAPKSGPAAGKGKLGPATDVRGEGGFVVGPGSRHRSGGQYEIVDTSRPMLALPAWLVEMCRKKETLSAPASSIDSGGSDPKEVERRKGLARAYLAAQPPAIEKAGGESATWQVCLYLTRTLELSPDAALALMNEGWNQSCQPPWPPEQLHRKLGEAQIKGDTPIGCAPPGFFDRLLAPAPQPAPPSGPPVLGALDPAPAPMHDRRTLERRAPNPEHRYTFDPGVDILIAKQKTEAATLDNVLEILLHQPTWRGVFQYDEFGSNILAVNPPTRLDAERRGEMSDVDITRFRSWCSYRHNLTVSEICAKQAIELAARRLSFHPVRAYLDSLVWDGFPRLDHAAEIFFGHTGVERELLCRFLIGAVRRIYQPGCKFDTMLVLIGPMGYRKSQFISALFGDDWTNRSKIAMGTKDGQSILAGAWVHEMPELSTFRRTDAETRKAFLRETFDRFRRAYTQYEVTVQRQCCFVGTTNDETFLEEDDRAIWPIEVVRKIDLDDVAEHRDQLWAEAVARCKAGEPHWLEDDSDDEVRAHREERTHEDPWISAIREQLERDPKREWTIAQILDTVVGIQLKDRTRSHELRVSRVLHTIGAARRRTKNARFFRIAT